MTIPAALLRRRDYVGPAIFSYGFRPFFFGGAVWAALAILAWIPQYVGALQWPTRIAPLDWHIHELLFGYVPAVIAGFLLTAIPNWTGRLPVNGVPLAALAALWLAGRVAMLMTGAIGLTAAAVIDVAFLAALLAITLREIVAGKNWRNLRVLSILALLIAANVGFHVEVARTGSADYAIRLGIGAIILLISLIGGRIIPSFTRNWLARMNPGPLPAPFGRFDAATIAASGVSLAAWVVLPEDRITGLLLLATGLLQLIRLARWAGYRTLTDRLVLILHLGYVFVPLGFLLVGAAILWPDAIPDSAGMHAWTAGAIGLVTMAVMTRASLGHTGQALAASPLTQTIYAALFAAAILRILAAFSGGVALLYVAAAFWILGFGAFAIGYGMLLLRRPPVWMRQ